MSGAAPRYRDQALVRRRAPAGPPIVLSMLPSTWLAAALLCTTLALVLCALFYGEYTLRLRLPVALRPAAAGAPGSPPRYEARLRASPQQLASIGAARQATLHLAGGGAIEGVLRLAGGGAACAGGAPCPVPGAAYDFTPAQPRALPEVALAEIAIERRRLVHWLFK